MEKDLHPSSGNRTPVLANSNSQSIGGRLEGCFRRRSRRCCCGCGSNVIIIVVIVRQYPFNPIEKYKNRKEQEPKKKVRGEQPKMKKDGETCYI
jgi:hypothetical protein